MSHNVIITGVGLRPVAHRFFDSRTGAETHLSIQVGMKEYKANIGAACALRCAEAGAHVHMVARNLQNLELIREWIREQAPDAQVYTCQVNLADPEAVKGFWAGLPLIGEEYDLIHSVGIGAGTVGIAGDNPYKLLEEIEPELVTAELSVIQMTITFFQHLQKHIRALREVERKESRVVVVSSMSAIRSVWSGSVHNAAKGGLSQLVNALMIELEQQHIYLTDIRPGAVDTGLYDSVEVRERVAKIAATYGYDWGQGKGLRLMSPLAVADFAVSALRSSAHATSINLVACGQWPHEGS